MFNSSNKIEGSPASWPVVTPHAHVAPLDPKHAAIVTELIWRCIEQWERVRWGARDMVHIVQMDKDRGGWEPRVWPLEIKSVEIWNSKWETASFEKKAMMGRIVFHGKGTFRVTSVVGNDAEPPAYAFEAWRLLYSYMFDNGNAALDEVVLRFLERGIDNASIGGDYITNAMSRSGALHLLRSK